VTVSILRLGAPKPWASLATTMTIRYEVAAAEGPVTTVQVLPERFQAEGEENGNALSTRWDASQDEPIAGKEHWKEIRDSLSFEKDEARFPQGQWSLAPRVAGPTPEAPGTRWTMPASCPLGEVKPGQTWADPFGKNTLMKVTGDEAEIRTEHDGEPAKETPAYPWAFKGIGTTFFDVRKGIPLRAKGRYETRERRQGAEFKMTQEVDAEFASAP
jgi:hypothetical protein